MTEETALVPIKPVDIPALFATEGAIDSILAEIEKRATDFEADVETAKGRKEIASMAHKVARSKTLIDGEGKKLVADMKAKTKVIDAERKRVRDFCDDLKGRVRQPLDEWEAAEEKRVENHRAEIESMKRCADPNWEDGTPMDSKNLKNKLEHLESFIEGPDWEEFEDEADRVKAESISTLKAHIARQEKYEAEQAELERLRKAEEERKAKEEVERIEQEQKEREERIRKEAEEKAKREAEQRERELKEAAARAEREKIEAAARAKAEQDAAVKAAEEKARRDAEEKERRRLEAERKEREAAERKAANKRHRAKIDREAVESFVAAGYDKKVAQAIIETIASGVIKHVNINY